VLFLDEPTTGLDPTSRLTLWDEVRRLKHEGTTVFLTTQYLEEADQLADRVGIIAGGRIVAEGTPASLKAEVGDPHLDIVLASGDLDDPECDPADPRALDRARAVVSRFGDQRPASDGCHLSVTLPDGARGVAGVVRALDDAGFTVASLELQQPSLDDVFLATTGEHLEGAEAAAPAQAQADGEAAPEAKAA
jgi:ABC-2 type transport system ATP-binding protein